MDQTMRDADLDESDEEYDENADEDFNPDQAAADGDENSSSDEEDAGKSRGKRKIDALADELDSGDEATIKERERIRKKQKKERQDEADGAASAGEEWRVQTRSQKLVEKAEKKQRRRAAAAGNVTIDVDQMWADLRAVPVGRVALPPPKLPVEEMAVDHERNQDHGAPGRREDELVTIKERIHYAGTIEEVEKQVLRSSKEAHDYFAAHPEATTAAGPRLAGTNARGLHRPMKRPSMFEPNPLSLVKGVPPDKLRPRAPNRVDVQMAEQRARDKKGGAVKMSTVQKSALDWRGFVDKQGLKDELDAYGRSNKGFLDREAFLDRAAATREQAARDARLKI